MVGFDSGYQAIPKGCKGMKRQTLAKTERQLRAIQFSRVARDEVAKERLGGPPPSIQGNLHLGGALVVHGTLPVGHLSVEVTN